MVHVRVGIGRQVRQDKLPQERQEGKSFQRVVDHAGMKVGMFQNISRDGIDLFRRGGFPPLNRESQRGT